MVHFLGRVQGVGFRYTVQNVAMQYDVRGYVRNLPDGSVELLIEGHRGDLDQIMECIQRKMDCFCRKVQVEERPATGQLEAFHIRHC